MDRDRMSTTSWTIDAIRGGSGTISHSVIAIAPGCPTSRHPTRDCGCKVFRKRADAEAYISERSPS
jgi:hypothetical protein